MKVTKREELEKAHKKAKYSRVDAGMVAVHMVQVRKIGVGETVANLVRSERWVRTPPSIIS